MAWEATTSVALCNDILQHIMTISENSKPYEVKSWSEAQEAEGKTSRSSTSSSNESPDPALDVCVRKSRPLAKGPMNLVLKTRIAKASQRELEEELMQTNTNSTQRTSFTTRSTEFLPEEQVEEEVTITDDGPIVQENLKEEDVYKKLNELNNDPFGVMVPKVVTTPERNCKSTPSTSPSCSSSLPTSSASSFYTASAMSTDNIISERSDDEISSESSTLLSDISGLTESFSRISNLADDSRAVPREVVNEAPLKVSFPEEEVRAETLSKVATKQPQKHNARHVSFSTVSIREYERILGDNPSCSCGPSIGIGWEFSEEETLPVSLWESWRETEREPERLVLGRDEREEMLLDLGYNHKVIAQAVREIVKVKNKRRQTIHNLSASGMEELMETAGRKVKKGIMSLKRRKKRNDDDEQSLSV